MDDTNKPPSKPPSPGPYEFTAEQEKEMRKRNVNRYLAIAAPWQVSPPDDAIDEK